MGHRACGHQISWLEFSSTKDTQLSITTVSPALSDEAGHFNHWSKYMFSSYVQHEIQSFSTTMGSRHLAKCAGVETSGCIYSMRPNTSVFHPVASVAEFCHDSLQDPVFNGYAFYRNTSQALVPWNNVSMWEILTQ